MIETPGAKIRENFGKSNRPRGGWVLDKNREGARKLSSRHILFAVLEMRGFGRDWTVRWIEKVLNHLKCIKYCCHLWRYNFVSSPFHFIRTYILECTWSFEMQKCLPDRLAHQNSPRDAFRKAVDCHTCQQTETHTRASLTQLKTFMYAHVV